MPKRGRKDLIERGRDELMEFVEAVAPTVESTIHTVGTKAQEAGTKAAPVLAEGQKMAKKKRKQLAASLAESLPEPMVERLPLERPRRKRRKLKALLLLAGLGAAGMVVARKVMDQRSASGWQSTYNPRSTTSPGGGMPTGGPASDATAPPTASADDRGAASPGEALSDQAEHAHRDTTPDDPAYVEQLDDAPTTEQRPGL